MDRVTVVGCGGSGKTYLSNRLAAVLGLPVTHLDAVHYDADWNPLPPDEFAARQRELVRGSRWLIEGNYASSLPIRLAATDMVIFLDLPSVTCLLGILQRRWRYSGSRWRYSGSRWRYSGSRWRYRGGQHTGVGVYDRITWGFVKYILGYRRSMRPRVRALLAEHAAHATVVTLTSRRATARFVAQVRTRAQS